MSEEKIDKRRGPRATTHTSVPAPIESAPAAEEPKAEAAPPETTEERIARLKAELAALAPADEPEAVLPEPEVNNMSSTEDIAAPLIQNVLPSEAKNPVHIVHFVADGLTALGRSFYQGEELSIEEGTELWEQTLDAGRSWLTYDEDEQIARWGQRKFRQGPWRGLGFTAVEFPVDEDGKPIGLTAAELEQLEALRRKQSLAAQLEGNSSRERAVSRPASQIGGSRPSSRNAAPPILPSSR